MSKKIIKKNNLEKALGITWAFSNPSQAFEFAKSEIKKLIEKTTDDYSVSIYNKYIDTLNNNKKKIREVA